MCCVDTGYVPFRAMLLIASVMPHSRPSSTSARDAPERLPVLEVDAEESAVLDTDMLCTVESARIVS